MWRMAKTALKGLKDAKETEEIIRSITSVTDCEGKRNRGDHKECHGRDAHRICSYYFLVFKNIREYFLVLF